MGCATDPENIIVEAHEMKVYAYFAVRLSCFVRVLRIWNHKIIFSYFEHKNSNITTPYLTIKHRSGNVQLPGINQI